MGPVGHGVISAAVGGGVWAATGSVEAASLTLIVGVFMDVDHVYDYYQWYIKRRPNKIYLWFHAWEYSIAGLILTAFFYHPLLLATALAHLAHVITDHLHNHMSPWGYSLSYRIIKGFDGPTIAPTHNTSTSYWHLLQVIPWGHRLAPWFQRRSSPPDPISSPSVDSTPRKES
ncbi:MAG: hypothetical protein ACE5Q6_01375 [Dehalococcoidia bacterium]